jgi:O-antigen ligase
MGSRTDITSGGVNKKALALWIAILVLTGTYFRTREQDTIPSTDWLTILQLLAGGFGILIGASLIKRYRCGYGGKAILAFLIAVASSALFSPNWELVLGYWIVLAGAHMLTVGLVAQSSQQQTLDRIEQACFVTVVIILLKDTVIALAFTGMDAVDDSGIFRLGMGLTHANTMSVMASIAFWLSFREDDSSSRCFLWWPVRCLLLAIVLLTRTRVAIVGLLMAGVVRSIIRYRCADRRSEYPLLIAIPCWLLSCVLLSALASLWGIGAVETVAAAFNRGEDAETVMSVTGRTEVWTHALEKISDAPMPQLLFGHGFGTTRFVLNDGYRATEYFASHAHNSLLEIALAVGLIGVVTFVITVLYGLRWLTGFARLQKKFSLPFALHAVSVLTIILLSSLTEPFLGAKVGPVAMIFVFYVTALDKRDGIRRTAEVRSL